MSRTEQFATRFYKLQQAKEEIAELELSKAIMEQSVAMESMKQVANERKYAEEQRSYSTSSDEWRLWSGYIARLEQLEDEEQRRVADMDLRLAEQRREMILAHRDTMKWETLSSSYERMAKTYKIQSEQKESDERAVMRFERR